MALEKIGIMHCNLKSTTILLSGLIFVEPLLRILNFVVLIFGIFLIKFYANLGSPLSCKLSEFTLASLVSAGKKAKSSTIMVNEDESQSLRWMAPESLDSHELTCISSTVFRCVTL